MTPEALEAAAGAAEAPSDPGDHACLTIRDAIKTAGPSRHVLVAGLALRLARQGHVREVRLKTTGGPEAAEAVLSFLAERPEADPPETAPGGLDTLRPEDGEPVAPQSVREACTGHPGEGHGRREESHPGETRVCGLCGASFPVNLRHAKGHRYCSAACRSKARHRRNRATPRGSGSAPFVLPDTVYLELADPTDAPDLWESA